MKTLMLALLLAITTAHADERNDKYLGDLNANQYDANSVNNPYGRYGSPYSPDSINNPYGRYGSRYSNESANNPYATHPPKLIEQNGAIRIYGQDK
jgi:hypothetical protein